MTDRPIIFSAPIKERFRKYVDLGGAGGCWVWLGARNAKGYGRFYVNGRTEMAHRVALWLADRQTPAGMDVDHICRNRACVNPSHLRVVSHRENLLSGDTITARCAARTHCPQGHPLRDENLVFRDGKRRCRECGRVRARSSYKPTTLRRRRRHLTKIEVAQIRQRIESGESHSKIASALSLSVATISNVRNGRCDYGR